MGGVVGSLLSMGSVIREFNINKVYVVFDGKGGSRRRKGILKEYKEGRTMTIRMNRRIDFDTEEEKAENMKHQLFSLSAYLDTLPINVVIVDRVEADDVIAYISEEYHKDDMTYIMSTDKDFLQLVSNNTFQYSPTRKKLYDIQSVIDEYNVHPNNMILFRAMEGDKSDRIDGIKGVGKKRIEKFMPYLIQESPISVEDFKFRLETDIQKSSVIDNVIQNFDIIERNNELMNLKLFNFPIDIKMRIRGIVEMPIKKLNKMEFLIKLSRDGLTHALRNAPEWLTKTFFTVI